MTPEYLEELADLADPDKLWRRAGLDRAEFTAGQWQQIDTGIALRRHASHVRRLRDLLNTGKSLLLTPLSLNGSDIRTVPIPDDIGKRQPSETPNGALSGLPEASPPPMRG